MGRGLLSVVYAFESVAVGPKPTPIGLYLAFESLLVKIFSSCFEAELFLAY